RRRRPTLFPYTTLFRSSVVGRWYSNRARSIRTSFRGGVDIPATDLAGPEPAPDGHPEPALYSRSARRATRTEPTDGPRLRMDGRSEEHTSELQSLAYLV